jgi:hypothetical protein
VGYDSCGVLCIPKQGNFQLVKCIRRGLRGMQQMSMLDGPIKESDYLTDPWTPAIQRPSFDVSTLPTYL